MKTIIKNKVKHFATLSADKLKSQTEKLSPFQKKIVVVLFCLLCSVISAHIILKTILLKTPDTVLLQHHLRAPHLIKTNTAQPPFSILPEDFNRVELVKKLLDSIARADTVLYSQIIKNRPHLLDTITLFEKLYQSQLKK